MKKNLLKFVTLMTLAAALLCGCGNKQTETQAPTETTSAQLSIGEYQETVRDLFARIETAANTNNAESDAEIITLIDTVKPLYEDILALEAPAELKDADGKLKESCRATIEALDISRQLMEIGDAVTADDLQKVSELQSRIDNMDAMEAQMQEALNSIYAVPTT